MDDAEHPPLLCKICYAIVPRRKEYRPKVCEACQKFFRRTARSRRKLVCTGAVGQLGLCSVAIDSRRSCTACRFQKCLEVGMRSKFLLLNKDRVDDEEGGRKIMKKTKKKQLHVIKQEKVDSNQLSTQVAMPLVRDPLLFDGEPVEKVLRVSVEGFTHLHGLEFLDLKRPDKPSTNIELLMELSRKQVFDGLLIGLTYGRHFLSGCGIDSTVSDSELTMLTCKAMASITVVFNNLTGSSGRSSLFGINDLFVPTIVSFFPDCQSALTTCRRLANAFEKWNPTFVESALLLGILFFNEAPSDNERLTRLRQRLHLAFNLQSSKAIEQRKRNFDRCLQLTRLAVSQVHNLMKAAADHVPLFALGSSVIQGAPIQPTSPQAAAVTAK